MPEKKCRTVPGQECKFQPKILNNPVNTTECKTVQENKCQIVMVPEHKKECTRVVEKKCRNVQDKVTEIVQVPNCYNYSSPDPVLPGE